MPLHPWCTVIMPFSWLLKAAAGRRWIRCKRLYAWLPGMPILWYLLGLGQIENNDESGALESFNEALKIEPSFIRALFNRALLNEKVGRLEQALQEFGKLFFPGKGKCGYSFHSCGDAVTAMGGTVRPLPLPRKPCAATRDMPGPGKFWNQLLDMEDKK